MSELLQIPNYQNINIAERAIVSADALAGQNTATFLDTQGFYSGDKVVLDPGAEIGELLTIQSINTSTKIVTFTSNLLTKHLTGTAIYKLFGDKIRLYRATNVDGNAPADSSFSLLSTADITAYNTFTQISDPAGDNTYWYKSTYYNADNSSETSLGLSYATRGGGDSHYVSIEDIRLESGFSSASQLDDSIFAARRDQAEAEVNGRLAAAGYIIPLQSTNGITFTPPLVENITRLLAAGYVLNQDYGVTTDGDTKNGDGKIKQANKLLEGIQAQMIVLLDTAGTALTRSLQISGWPDSSTESVGTDGIHGEPFQSTMSKRF